METNLVNNIANCKNQTFKNGKFDEIWERFSGQLRRSYNFRNFRTDGRPVDSWYHRTFSSKVRGRK